MIASAPYSVAYLSASGRAGTKGPPMFPTTDTIHRGKFNLMRAFDLSIFRAFSEGDDEDDKDESDGDETDDGGEEGSSGTDDTTDKSKDKSTRDPEARARSREAAKYRNERNQRYVMRHKAPGLNQGDGKVW